jgi:dolichol kinase
MAMKGQGNTRGGRALFSPAFRQEGLRKLFHLFSAGYAVLYVQAGRETTLWVLGGAVFLGGALETIRLGNERINQWLIRRFMGIHREEESHRPSGIFWTLVGCFLTALLVPEPDIVVAAMLYLAVGDGLAGFVGRTWGRLRIGNKSVEGSLACFLGAWGAGALVLTPAVGRPDVLFGAVFVTVVEAISPPPNDNLTLPLFAGLALHFFRVWT